MRRGLWLGILGFLCCASLGGSAPVRPVPQRAVPVEPGGGFLETHTFKGGERATVIGIGRERAAYLGLYIYDEHGNCVTWDDVGNASTRDDLAVEWFPPATAPYTLEIRNFGLILSKVDLAVR